MAELFRNIQRRDGNAQCLANRTQAKTRRNDDFFTDKRLLGVTEVCMPLPVIWPGRSPEPKKGPGAVTSIFDLLPTRRDAVSAEIDVQRHQRVICETC